ncbi:MAG: hypothetical protein JNM94_00445 [Phycisphaerae bacterium]|nr:hypothetical protein [Phycisphaerae bacterium]
MFASSYARSSATALLASFVTSVAMAGATGSPTCPCVTDLDYDGMTAGSDLGILLGGWGGSGNTDFDGSGTTDGADLGILLGAWGPCTPPSNDNCINAEDLEGTSTFVEFCNNAATDSDLPFPATCGDDNDVASIGKDVWYQYKMPYTGALIVHTYDSSFDTVLGVYSNIIAGACGCPGVSPNAVLLACDDDANSTLQSFVEVPAYEGQCMNIRVGGYKGIGGTDAGPGILTVRPIKRGDRCDLAHIVPSTQYIEIPGTNEGDTWIQADQSSCANGDTLDEWYRFSMPCDGELTISTCHPSTDFDTTISVFTNCLPSGAEIACNDDFSDPDCALDGNFRRSRVSLIGSSSDTFYVRVSGFQGATGNFQLIFDVDCVN